MKAPSDYEMARIESVLGTRFGLERESLGSDSLRQALHRRMAATASDTGHAYLEQLLADEDELSEFVEEFLVPETWFFRDVRPFQCLRRFAAGRRSPGALFQKLRLLSVPCSTGEEPYSMAMTLLDLGLQPPQFLVDGVDLSRLALAKAADGVYRKSSFRGDQSEFGPLLDRYLRRLGDRSAVVEEVRAPVRFRRANLLATNFLGDQPPYDVIFCRNVLIYFHADARRIVLAHLRRLLAPGGLLYVGHVEAGIVADGPFRSIDEEYPFAFCPLDDGPADRDDTAVQSPKRTQPGGSYAGLTTSAGVTPDAITVRSPVPRAASTVTAAPKPASPRTLPQPESEEDLLQLAREAADSGRLEEAATICDRVLAKHPASADAFCLLGLTRKARGALPEAEKLFQKVLYLSPRHREALVHMMLLAGERGDDRAAANYRRRAEQVARTRG